ncbi:MAG: ribosome maturation factor RimM [Alphaproteobacteria bacterium]
MTKRVCVGAVAGSHGVRGLVRVKPFTEDPAAVAAYGPVEDEAGARRFNLAVTGRAKGVVVVRIEGIADRDAAEALKGVRLYVPRAALPEPEADDFYQSDLLGLRVETLDGQRIGRVKAVQNFGAGDLLEIAPERGPSFFLPFTRETVPEVDIGGGRVVVAPAPGSLPGDESPEDREDVEDAGNGGENDGGTVA